MTFEDLGTVDYESTWSAMNAFTLGRDENQEDECWFLQHNPVFTLGQAGKPEHILNPHQIPVVNTDRGGQVTYHGPGQLVAYLLVDIKRRKIGIRQLVDLIENSIIELLDGYGIVAATRKGAPGVYVEEKKIAALGLRIKQGCSYHGLSLNVDMDLEPFSYINPCGYPGMSVTQLRELLEEPQENLFKDVQARLQSILSRPLL
ncbi:MAG: lipoyl(octanoyl) transferase LipB [Gammaproteobacteria bacterium]|nr:lipoyl(octanoyl) transferase LipB [Gammaproteobacteria bacterium]